MGPPPVLLNWAPTFVNPALSPTITDQQFNKDTIAGLPQKAVTACDIEMQLPDNVNFTGPT